MKYSDYKYSRAVGNKYGAHKTAIDGHNFDSFAEANRYSELKILERAGKIKELKMQVPFELIPTQRDENGVLIESKVNYIADFTYKDDMGNMIVEDVKGAELPVWIIKRKLMLYVHGIRVKVVR